MADGDDSGGVRVPLRFCRGRGCELAIERLKDKPLMELELKVCESQISHLKSQTTAILVSPMIRLFLRSEI